MPRYPKLKRNAAKRNPTIAARIPSADVKFLERALSGTAQTKGSWLRKVARKEIQRMREQKKLLREYKEFADKKYDELLNYNEFADKKYESRDDVFSAIFSD